MIKVKFDTTLINNNVSPDFAVFPNPTRDYLSIQSQTRIGISQYKVSDISGKTVLIGELKQNPNGQSRIDLSALQKGLYFVILNGDQINRVVKVVKD